jgi:hypothetical protein
MRGEASDDFTATTAVLFLHRFKTQYVTDFLDQRNTELLQSYASLTQTRTTQVIQQGHPSE